MTLQRARNAKGGCPIGSLAGQLAEQDEGARLELADGLDRWEITIREGLERMAARGELHTGANPGRACPKHPRSHPRRPAAHASPARSQPAPLSPERRDQRDPRRARRTLILGADVMRTHPQAAKYVRSNPQEARRRRRRGPLLLSEQRISRPHVQREASTTPEDDDGYPSTHEPVMAALRLL